LERGCIVFGLGLSRKKVMEGRKNAANEKGLPPGSPYQRRTIKKIQH
jgi:hypothetical protein